MKKVLWIVLTTLVLLGLVATRVYAATQESVTAIKEVVTCVTGDMVPCTDGYLYHVIVWDIDADMVMVEVMQDESDTYEILATEERGTNSFVTYTAGFSSQSGDCKFRVTAFNFDRSTRLIPVAYQDRTGVAFLPIMVK